MLNFTIRMFRSERMRGILRIESAREINLGDAIVDNSQCVVRYSSNIALTLFLFNFYRNDGMK